MKIWVEKVKLEFVQDDPLLINEFKINFIL